MLNIAFTVFCISLYFNTYLLIPYQNAYFELKFYNMSALKLIFAQYFVKSIHGDVLWLRFIFHAIF